ncbi:MAG TPA: hypothetical protein PLQ78_04345 [Flavipsychrobacter sp.]|nr:hypothetical protein [Flavipsychrobacter sp.]
MLLPLLLVFTVAEYGLRNIPNDYQFKKKQLEQAAPSIKILILGSSHSYFNISPQFLKDKAFNLGYSSQPLKYDNALYQHYSSKLSTLHTLVLSISYNSFYWNLEDAIEQWRAKNYVIYYDLKNESSFKNYFEITSNKGSFNYHRLVNYYLKHQSVITCDSLGWGTPYTSSKQKDLSKSAELAIKRHTQKEINSPKSKECFHQNLTALKQLINSAALHRVNVLLITTPTYYTYSKKLNQAQLQQMTTSIEQLLATSPNVAYLNMMNDHRFLKTDFYDADHLNDIGAKKLTLIIDSFLKTQYPQH